MSIKPYEEALKRYTKVVERQIELKEKHREIFEALEVLESEKQAAESNLKKAAVVANEPIENKLIQVKIVEAWKKWFDYATILKIAKPAELALINEKATITEVDKVIFEDLVESGQIRPELKQKSFKEAPLTPKVFITLKGAKNEKGQKN